MIQLNFMKRYVIDQYSVLMIIQFFFYKMILLKNALVQYTRIPTRNVWEL